MRYYFHLHDHAVTRDEEGLELPNYEAALHEAQLEARIMGAENVRDGHLDLSHYIEVADSAGAVLFRVKFADVIKVAR